MYICLNSLFKVSHVVQVIYFCYFEIPNIGNVYTDTEIERVCRITMYTVIVQKN